MGQALEIKPLIKLHDFDPDYHADMDKEAVRQQTAEMVRKIGELQEKLYANARSSLLVILQGMDTSGKDGAVKKVFQDADPASVHVTSFKKPAGEELVHDYLWRIHQSVPRFGFIGVFNRSQYEDILVPRVLKLVPREVWSKRYEQVNAFENCLQENGVKVLKFYLHISKEEQAERLRARLEDPTKNWKFNVEDLKMRQLWDDFQHAYQDILNLCSPKTCPWHLVPANRKWYRDFVIAEKVLQTLQSMKLQWPAAQEDLTKIKIL